MTALIAAINDDQHILDLIDAILTEAGYRVLPIKEGDKAYKIVQREQPDLILLDIRLGNPEGGWLVLEQLKLDPATTAIPVIICSGDIQFLKDKRELLISKGCGIVEKPFGVTELLEAVTAALPAGTGGIAGTALSTPLPDTPQPPTTNGRKDNESG